MTGNSPPNLTGAIPLCVDLDGTLVVTDTLLEIILAALANKPAVLLAALPKLLSGRAAFKQYLSNRVELDPRHLKYHAEVIAKIKQARAENRRVLLVTGADNHIANRIAAHFGFFDEVLGSDGTVNLTREDKAQLLKTRFGQGGFDYIGNSSADIPVWKVCRTPYLAGSMPVPSCLKERGVERLTSTSHPMLAMIRALRPHQWLKNLLIFIPVLTAHQLTNPSVLCVGAVAFVAFSLVSSATYLLNDLIDLPHDRANPAKKNRPLASGKASLSLALILTPLLAFAGVTLAFALQGTFGWIVLGYGFTTTLYSLRLKRILITDVVCLALLYTVRIIAGNAVTEIAYSPWLLALSVFAFYSLALMKRCSEISPLVSETKASGRSYYKEDQPILFSLGIASAFISILVMALYINTPAISPLYRRPYLLWGLCPMMMYWYSRAWVLTHRGKMHQDPVIFAITDQTSHLVAAIVFAILWLAA